MVIGVFDGSVGVHKGREDVGKARPGKWRIIEFEKFDELVDEDLSFSRIAVRKEVDGNGVIGVKKDGVVDSRFWYPMDDGIDEISGRVDYANAVSRFYIMEYHALKKGGFPFPRVSGNVGGKVPGFAGLDCRMHFVSFTSESR